MKNDKIDINVINEKKGWIQDYADKHLAAIQLHTTDEGVVCHKCKLTYKEV